MARVVIFSSGNGSNFQAIAEALLASGKHQLVLMVCNKKCAYSFERAKQLGIPSYHIDYRGRERKAVEEELVTVLKECKTDLVVLAGFMKLLTPILLDAFPKRVINIHPALLPKYPGTDGIGESFASGDAEAGITIHYVDYGMDTGEPIEQVSFSRSDDETLESFETKIHQLEYKHYPKVVLNLLDKIDASAENSDGRGIV